MHKRWGSIFSVFSSLTHFFAQQSPCPALLHEAVLTKGNLLCAKSDDGPRPQGGPLKTVAGLVAEPVLSRENMMKGFVSIQDSGVQTLRFDSGIILEGDNSGCNKQNNGFSHSNPRSLWVAYLTWQRGLPMWLVENLHKGRWMILHLSGWVWCNHRGPNKGKREAGEAEEMNTEAKFPVMEFLALKVEGGHGQTRLASCLSCRRHGNGYSAGGWLGCVRSILDFWPPDSKHNVLVLF